MHFLRFAIALALAALPSFLKIPIYRWFLGFKIGRGVRIGFSPFVGVKRCTIGDKTRIGSFNLFQSVGELCIGGHVHIGFMNLFRGGDSIEIGDYATILRTNVCNAIVEGDFLLPTDSRLKLGTGVFLATGHWLDFSDGIIIGDHTIIGGRHSSFWTHNRQRGRSITVGSHVYLGSEVRLAPGCELPDFSIVALGSVVSGHHAPSRSLIGGNPAKVLRPLSPDDYYLVTRKTRQDIPDEIAYCAVPDDLRRSVGCLLLSPSLTPPSVGCVSNTPISDGSFV